MGFVKKSFAPKHKRWRHKSHKYVVEILSVTRSNGTHGVYETVMVKGSARSKERKVQWAVDKFRELFEPIGRKVKAKSVWEHLLEDKDP